MKIAIIANPDFPAPPHDGYGGTQRGAYELSDGLAERSHDVTLVASGDSVIYNDDITLLHNSTRSLCAGQNPSQETYETGIADSRRRTIRMIGELAANSSLDVINLRWEDPILIRSLSNLSVPLVVSIGCSLKPDTTKSLFVPGNVSYTTHTHAHKHAIGAFNELQVAPYGIDMSKVAIGEKPLISSENESSLDLLREIRAKGQDYVVHTGTIVPKKGQLSAIRIAQLAKIPLVLVGTSSKFPAHHKFHYFNTQIQPHIDNKTVYHFGNANEAQKYELMRFAKSSLFTSGMEDPTFVEPFGRVLAESTASGTPVVGYKYGSYNELIKENITGLGFRTVEEAAEKLQTVGDIDRVACGLQARRDMSSERFIENMESLFQNMVNDTTKQFTLAA